MARGHDDQAAAGDSAVDLERLQALLSGLATSPEADGEAPALIARIFDRLDSWSRDLARRERDLADRRSSAPSQAARLRALLDLSSEASVMTSIQGVIEYANAAAGRLLEVEPARLRGTPITELLEEDDRQTFRYELSSIGSREGARSFDVRVRPGGRAPVTVRLTAAILEVGDRGSLGWIIREADERRRLDRGRAIDELSRTLEKRIAERTRALELALAENRALLASERLARQAAEQANEHREEFLATISHELRTPLNAVLGWTRLLRVGAITGVAARHTFEVIERNALAQVRLVDDLLNVARLRSGRIQLASRVLDLTALVRRAVEIARPMGAAKLVTVTYAGDDGEVRVRGDDERLQQVVWNLLGNGVKFTDPGGEVRVEVRAEGEDAKLTIADNGVGISAEFLPHVFEPFRQADTGPRRRHGGLGLGLSIVRELVDLHGGTIEVRSEGEGRGTTIVVRLPLVTSSERSAG